MFEAFRLQALPSPAKLFVGLFTTLMVCVCVWAVSIYYVDKSIEAFERGPLYEQESTDIPNPQTGDDNRLRENFGLAHTHINGQTLLFFAVGFVFLATSRPARQKKLVLSLFASSIVVHAIGLSGQGYFWLFDDLLALSGLAILVCILYMALMIYADLLQSPPSTREHAAS